VPSLEKSHGSRSLITVPLLRRESIGESYHVLWFDMPQGTPARPGQFTMIRGGEWGEAPLLPRPMSYLSGGTTPSMLVKVHGEGTIRMGRAEPGEPFSLLGPLGNGWRAHDPTKRQVLVAGGVGIAPLLFLARELVVQGQRPVLLYGGRTARDLPLADDALELCDLEIATEDGSRGFQGRVTELLTRWLSPNVEVFTCGPDRMMAAVAQKCAAVSVPCEVSLEAPMACGFGICLGCAIPTTDGGYLYACAEGPCLNAHRIDWERNQNLTVKTVKGGAK
jgi:dihydroorotate dehydrogenase electron transfer subunit